MKPEYASAVAAGAAIPPMTAFPEVGVVDVLRRRAAFTVPVFIAVQAAIGAEAAVQASDVVQNWITLVAVSAPDGIVT